MVKCPSPEGLEVAAIVHFFKWVVETQQLCLAFSSSVTTNLGNLCQIALILDLLFCNC